MLDMTKLWQNIFVATELLLWQMFVVTNTCMLPQKFCCDKRRVLSQQTRVCRDKSKLVVTEVQNYVRCDKSFVVTKTCLLQQALLLRQKWVLSNNKSLSLLAAALANDSKWGDGKQPKAAAVRPLTQTSAQAGGVGQSILHGDGEVVGWRRRLLNNSCCRSSSGRRGRVHFRWWRWPQPLALQRWNSIFHC